jgi:hypothetical protein
MNEWIRVKDEAPPDDYVWMWDGEDVYIDHASGIRHNNVTHWRKIDPVGPPESEKNRFTRHIPDFVDYRDAPPSFEFYGKRELLNHPMLKAFSDKPGFSHFALDDNYLLSISDHGFKWWVVGWLDKPVDLPQWDHGKVIVDFGPDRGGVAYVLGKDVASYCAGQVRMKDGSSGQDLRNTPDYQRWLATFT